MADLHRLKEKARSTPGFLDEPRWAFWSRSGVTHDVVAAGALSFGPSDVVGSDATS